MCCADNPFYGLSGPIRQFGDGGFRPVMAAHARAGDTWRFLRRSEVTARAHALKHLERRRIPPGRKCHVSRMSLAIRNYFGTCRAQRCARQSPATKTQVFRRPIARGDQAVTHVEVFNAPGGVCADDEGSSRHRCCMRYGGAGSRARPRVDLLFLPALSKPRCAL